MWPSFSSRRTQSTPELAASRVRSRSKKAIGTGGNLTTPERGRRLDRVKGDWVCTRAYGPKRQRRIDSAWQRALGRLRQGDHPGDAGEDAPLRGQSGQG